MNYHRPRQLACPRWIKLGFVPLIVGSYFPAQINYAQQPPAPVVVAEVQQREVSAGQSLLGTVMPHRHSVIGSAVDGRVLEFPANDGDWVTQGQPLAQLRTATIEIELAAAKAELTLRQHELAELEVLLPEEIAQAQAEVTRSKALLEYARSKLDRTQSLFQKGTSITRDELDEARSLYLAAEQVGIRAQSSYKQLNRTREQRFSQANARILVQQETVNQISDRLAKYAIRAPFDGYVVAEFTEVGAWISQGDPVAEVVELNPVEVSVAVPESIIAALHAAYVASREQGRLLEVPVKTDAMPDQLFAGQVTHIVPRAEARTRAFPVKVRIENPDHLLKAGMLASVTLPVGARQQAVLVPKDALVLGGSSPIVMVVVNDPQSNQAIAKPAPVTLGVAEGSLIQVRGDLRAGQQVVVRGNERLRPGQAINVVRVEEAQ